MKYIAICIKGLEDISIKEINEILNVDAKKIIEGRLEFESDDVKKLIKKSQSVVKVYEKWGELKFDLLDDIIDYVDGLNLEVKKPFKTSCHREGEHVFNSQEVEREIGIKIDGEHDLKEPEEIVFIDIVDNVFLFGLDLTKRLLSKRDYRIKISNQSVNACIAYGMIRLSGFDEDKILVDPFSRDGVVAIEAALYKKGKINAFDELFHHVRSCEINAKMAGVNKKINFSRTDIDWLDTKFKENEVDCVVTVIPFPSKHVSEKTIKKIYDQFFYQVKFILKGKVVVVGQNLDLFKEMLSDFKILDERIVKTGGLEQEIVVFEKR